ncbi:MAG: WYL domain-containing protein, partial [Candidatus Poseidoniales archaeon]|nr:WYL domain-containing protein [Candidatus Poseidoniales archaeon]
KRAAKHIGGMNSAITNIVKEAISWLSPDEVDVIDDDRLRVRFGRRQLANLLNGSSNQAALTFQFHKCPYWGSLSFLSVRKIDRIVRHMVIYGVLCYVKSPQLNLNVLAINDTLPKKSTNLGFSELFANDVKLPLEDVDIDLFLALSRRRRALSWMVAKRKGRGWPMKVCTDRILILICLRRPKDLTEFKKKILGVSDETIRKHGQSLIDVYMGESEADKLSQTAKALYQAIENGQDVSIRYPDSKTDYVSSRTITPQDVYFNLNGVEYCDAYCHTRKENRMFRISKIEGFTILE